MELTHRSGYLGMLGLPDAALLKFGRIKNQKAGIAAFRGCSTYTPIARDADTTPPRCMTGCC